MLHLESESCSRLTSANILWFGLLLWDKPCSFVLVACHTNKHESAHLRDHFSRSYCNTAYSRLLELPQLGAFPSTATHVQRANTIRPLRVDLRKDP
jgi:hypothetical protein